MNMTIHTCVLDRESVCECEYKCVCVYIMKLKGEHNDQHNELCDEFTRENCPAYPPG